MSTQRPLVFNVRKAAPELIPPASLTPKEFKELSDVDDQEVLRFNLPIILIYNKNGQNEGLHDPAKVIKDALGQALVSYYPFAGRLREKAGGKLVVECNGEGVLFVEADADVTLEDFGDALEPPFPCIEDLSVHVPNVNSVVNSPLMLIQVTRLKCDGFILTIAYNHTMADGFGFFQFLITLANYARVRKPFVQPVWERHLLRPRDPPQVTCIHPEYVEFANTKNINIPLEDMVHKSFFFGPREITSLRCLLPPRLTSATTNEVVSACIWWCRTMALQLHPDEEVRFVTVVNARSILNPPLPNGYYGNVVAFLAAITTVAELCGKPLGYAVELLQKAKSTVTNEYIRSLIDFIHIKGRPCVITAARSNGQSFVASNLTQLPSDLINFGWGPPVFAGITGEVPEIATFYMACKNKKGERGILVPLCLTSSAMERFEKVLRRMLAGSDSMPSVIIPSSL